MLFDDEVIYAYTRAQAIEDGVLVDVSDTAREAGFTIPVAVTRGVWTTAVAWLLPGSKGQDEAGRLWDVLWLAAQCARAHRNQPEPRVNFQVRVLPENSNRRRVCRFSLHIGPGDAGEPVITIMLPDED